MIPFALPPIATRWLVLALVVLAAFAAGALWNGDRVHTQWREAEAKAALEATRIITRQGEVTVRVVERWRTRQAEAQTVIQTIEKEIVRHVPNDADPVLPLGWRLLHDAAAAGAVPQTAAGTDVAARDIKASAAARAVVGNYGTCHENALQLEALQAWVRHMYETTNLEALRW